MTTIAAGSHVPTIGAAAWLDTWYRMWNGRTDLAYELIADELTVHLPRFGMPPEHTVHDPRTMRRWIELFRSSYRSARFTCELGPFTVGELILARFRLEGIWEGGRPTTATALPGTSVSFAGMDIVRFEHGRVREYWLTDDQLDLYAQLGAVPA